MAKKKSNPRKNTTKILMVVVLAALLTVGIFLWRNDRANAPVVYDVESANDAQELAQDITVYVAVNEEVIPEGWESDVYETLLTNNSIGCWAQVSPSYFGPEGMEAYDEAKLIEGLRAVEDKGYTYEVLSKGETTVITRNSSDEKVSKKLSSVNAKIQGFDTTFYQRYAFIQNDSAYYTSITLSCDKQEDLVKAEEALAALEIKVN